MAHHAHSLTTIRNPRYGWLPDLPDHRDKLYLHVMKLIEKLPKTIDLRKNDSPIQDQGQLGSCTANALAGNLDYIKKQKINETETFSRLFIYYNERVIEHTVGTDSGAMLRDGIKTLVNLGACFENEWPYDIDKFTDKPSEKAFKDALDYQITSYYRLGSLDEMKNTLALGFPFVFGFSVYESFESEDVAKTGIVPMPGKSERLLGGHAVMAIGYDDEKKRFIIRNSWGSSWGDRGYCYMPYDYLSDDNLASDFWTVRDME
ncbi:MAG TPA: C1 family peptidase [Patescibacteria group bacterium]|nr:C1 family peptidase [Patescibacteria group bacterium]